MAILRREVIQCALARELAKVRLTLTTIVLSGTVVVACSGSSQKAPNDGTALGKKVSMCVVGDLPFYDEGVQQMAPENGKFRAGTVLVADDPEELKQGNTGVTDRRGHHTFVDGTKLVALPNPACKP